MNNLSEKDLRLIADGMYKGSITLLIRSLEKGIENAKRMNRVKLLNLLKQDLATARKLLENKEKRECLI